MTTKHFPGPWEVSKNDPLAVVAPAPAGASEPWRKRRVCTVQKYVNEEASAANAFLIAAAPALLAALEEIASAELDEGDKDPSEPTFGARHYVAIARAAIAAVKGGKHGA